MHKKIAKIAKNVSFLNLTFIKISKMVVEMLFSKHRIMLPCIVLVSFALINLACGL